MDVFSYNDYKTWVRETVSAMPKGGRGQYKAMAEALSMSTVMISQIFNGERQLSLEHAWQLRKFFGWTELEAKYFLSLVQVERAGHHELKSFFEQQAETIRRQSQDLKTRLPQNVKLSEEQKAVFYSRWYYSAVRLAVTLPGTTTPHIISQVLELPVGLVSEALEFLLHHGLIKKENDGYKLTSRRIHLESKSPFIQTRHTSWRLKAIHHMTEIRDEDLFFSAPMSIPSDNINVLRKELVGLIDSLGAKVKGGPVDSLACLNIDLFRFS